MGKDWVIMSVYFNIHKSDEEARKYLNKVRQAPSTEDCFAGYPYIYEGDDSEGNVYFGFYTHPNISKLAEEINENFNNIKIEIIGMREFEYDDNELYLGRWVNPPDKFNYCLFRVKLSDYYSKESKFILSLTMAQFVRVYCPAYKHFDSMKNVKDNFIDNSIKAQDTNSYGAWLCCDFNNHTCSRDTFNKMDDIDLVNGICIDNVYLNDMPYIYKFIRVLEGSKPPEYMMDMDY